MACKGRVYLATTITTVLMMKQGVLSASLVVYRIVHPPVMHDLQDRGRAGFDSPPESFLLAHPITQVTFTQTSLVCLSNFLIDGTQRFRREHRLGNLQNRVGRHRQRCDPERASTQVGPSLRNNTARSDTVRIETSPPHRAISEVGFITTPAVFRANK